MMTKIRNLLKSKDGATAIEYGLIAAATGLVLVGLTNTLGGNLRDLFQAISDGLVIPGPTS